eukprot:7184150-Pyramimonas_sp.AAC.2
MLTTAGAREEVIACAKHYKCASCAERKRASQPPKSAPTSWTTFNQALYLDFFVFKLRSGSARIARALDGASRFQKCRIVNRETTAEAIKSIEKE